MNSGAEKGGGRSFPFVVFGLALLVRAAYIVALRSSALFDHMVVDAALYDKWGLRIAAGQWLGERPFYDPPLYAYFLGVLYAVFGHDYLITRVVQIIIGSAHCVVIYALASRVLDRRAGVAAGLFAALYKPLIFYDGAIMKAFLTSTMIDAGLLALLAAMNRKKLFYWLAAGLLLGLSALTRANMLGFILLGVLLFAYGILKGRWMGGRKKTAAAFAFWSLGIISAILPAAAHNYKVSGQFIIVSSYMGQNFYTGNNPYNTSGNYQRIPFVRANPKYEEDDFRNEAARRTGNGAITPAEVSRFWMKQSLEFIGREPVAFIKRILTRFRIFWGAYEVPDTYNMDFEARHFTPFLKLPFLGFSFIAPLGLLGMALTWKKAGKIWPIYLFMLGYMAVIIAFFVFSRYRLSVVGPLLAFAGAGVSALWDLRRNVRKLAVAGGVLLALCVLVNYPAYYKVRDSEGFTNLATLMREDGDMDRAIEYYRKALSIDPSMWEARYFLAVTLREDGQCGAAVNQYRRLLAANPRFADALAGAAMCYAQMGEYKPARDFYLQALVNKPGLADVRVMLIRLMIRTGELDGAEKQLAILRRLYPQNAEIPALRRELEAYERKR